MPRKGQPMSDAARENLRQKARDALERKRASATATLEPPSDSQPVAVEEDEPASEEVLAQLATLFQKASGEKQGRDKAVNEALDLLGKLDPFKYPDIADNPAVLDFVDKVQMQRAVAQDLPPGSIIGSGIWVKKIPWTKAQLL